VACVYVTLLMFMDAIKIAYQAVAVPGFDLGGGVENVENH